MASVKTGGASAGRPPSMESSSLTLFFLALGSAYSCQTVCSTDLRKLASLSLQSSSTALFAATRFLLRSCPESATAERILAAAYFLVILFAPCKEYLDLPASFLAWSWSFTVVIIEAAINLAFILDQSFS
jgi:hypothetical protein